MIKDIQILLSQLSFSSLVLRNRVKEGLEKEGSVLAYHRLLQRMRFLGITFLFIFIFLSCKKNDVEDCFISRGEETTVIRAIDDFTDIDVRGFFEIILTQDSINSVTIETGENIIPFIKTTVADNVLTISNEIECNWVRDYGHPKIHISVKDLEYVFMKEPCNLVSTNTIVNEEIYIWARANLGEANVKVECDKFKFLSSHRTAGIYEFSGSCNEFEINTWGATKVIAGDLKAGSIKAVSNSAGDMFVYASESITAKINSDGDVICKGKPAIVEIDGEGSGRLVLE